MSKKFQNHNYRFGFLFSVLPIFVFTMLFVVMGPQHKELGNGLNGLPSRTAGPPIRDTPGPPGGRITPTATAVATDPAPISPTSGAYIRLEIMPEGLVYWTEIEWQDGLGDWHKVDGWRGSTTNDQIQWFVGSELLGSGPFRWLVFSEENEMLLGVTNQFCMPSNSGDIQILTINLDENFEREDSTENLCATS